jgi:phosphatidylserine/phosphatidylglycerophosphate/cardiolipin synthase-like enzyme
VLAGSHNWTYRALTANREASWLVEDPAQAARAETWLASVPGW